MVRFLFQHKRKGEKSRLWSARVRLDGWAKPKTFPLHVTDKRVAEQKLAKLIEELEREAAGIGTPKVQKEAAATALAVHLQAYAAELEGLGRAKGTLTKYTQMLPKMFRRCGWKELRDVSVESFLLWRRGCGLKPKSMNDNLTCAITFFNWMKRNRLIAANPLEGVPKVADEFEGRFRRALSVEEIGRLLQVAPIHRAVVYQAILYTGLRRSELSGLKWGDFDFTVEPVRLRVPSSLSKNRKESTHFLRPELAETLRSFRPATAKPGDFAFRGLVPRVPTFKRDLEAAGIPFEDERGRRVDIHALRTTFGTMLSASGVSPRVAMELMRHSDLKLTMKTYTDTAQLPLVQEAARLPSFGVAGVEPVRRSRKRGPRAVVVDGVLVVRQAGAGAKDGREEGGEEGGCAAAVTPELLRGSATGTQELPVDSQAGGAEMHAVDQGSTHSGALSDADATSHGSSEPAPKAHAFQPAETKLPAIWNGLTAGLAEAVQAEPQLTSVSDTPLSTQNTQLGTLGGGVSGCDRSLGGATGRLEVLHKPLRLSRLGMKKRLWFPRGAIQSWSGRRDSNSRRPPWQGGALPTELHPQSRRIGVEF